MSGCLPITVVTPMATGMVTRAMMARMGRPKNTSSPQPMAGPMLVEGGRSLMG